jgi:hypothetical protein
MQQQFLSREVEIRWSKPPQKYRHAYIFEGSFVSPGAEFVPEASRICTFQMLYPADMKTSSTTTKKDIKSTEDIEAFIRDRAYIPAVTLLPPTVKNVRVCSWVLRNGQFVRQSDHSSSLRIEMLGMPLARRNIASIVPVIPFYGIRKPDYQVRLHIDSPTFSLQITLLRKVSKLFNSSCRFVGIGRR